MRLRERPLHEPCGSEPIFEEFTEAQAGRTPTPLRISTPAGTVQDDLRIAAVTLDGGPGGDARGASWPQPLRVHG